MAKRLPITLRAQEALKLRLQGHSYSAIASTLGYSHTTAIKDVQAALAPERQASDGRAHLRLEHDARYRALLVTWWPKARAKKPSPIAARLVLEIQRELADLWGLDVGQPLERDGFSDALLAVLKEWDTRPPQARGIAAPAQPAVPDPTTFEAVWEEMSSTGEVVDA